MISMMWLSNVVGEYLTKLSQPPEVAPVSLPRLIDDPVTTLEQTVMDLRIAQESKETSGSSQASWTSDVLLNDDGNHNEAPPISLINISVDS